MADREHPSTKWDGSPFEDVLRLGLVGCPLLFRACLVAIKGDWKEVAESLGFSTWATKDAPCYSCWCTKANFFFDQAFSVVNNVWPDFTMSDYEAACTSSEISIVVRTVEMLRRIRSALFFDRRGVGAHGRALRSPVSGTSLQAGDRLEPRPGFADVAKIDRLTKDHLPITLLFWRTTQARVKHRNPLFNNRTGVTPLLIAPDQLHALNLGSLQRFSQELLWAMMFSSVWVGKEALDQKSWVERCLIPLRADLRRWEDEFNRDHPSHKPTKVQPITPGLVGRPTNRLLKLKAAEMKVCFRFLHSKILEEWASVHNGQLWLQASRAMHDLLLEIEGQPWKLSDEQVQEKKKRVYPASLSLSIYIYIYICIYIYIYIYIYIVAVISSSLRRLEYIYTL